jgi:hypothetical protein
MLFVYLFIFLSEGLRYENFHQNWFLKLKIYSEERIQRQYFLYINLAVVQLFLYEV